MALAAQLSTTEQVFKTLGKAQLVKDCYFRGPEAARSAVAALDQNTRSPARPRARGAQQAPAAGVSLPCPPRNLRSPGSSLSPCVVLINPIRRRYGEHLATATGSERGLQSAETSEVTLGLEKQADPTASDACCGPKSALRWCCQDAPAMGCSPHSHWMKFGIAYCGQEKIPPTQSTRNYETERSAGRRDNPK
jgi:hypothetical protein